MNDEFAVLRRRHATHGEQYYELEEMGGTTALGLLAIKNNIGTFMELMQLSDNHDRVLLNTPDLYGNTPLHYFALRGANVSRGVLAMLEERGGDCHARNHAGESVFDVLKCRRITCKEPYIMLGAQFCAVRLAITVVPI